MGMSDETRELFESINDSGGNNHRDRLVGAVRNNDKEQLMALLDNSDDSDIKWLLDLAKGALNSPVFYALIAHKFGGS